MSPTKVTAWAAGRLNIIGEHTDYSGGLALPMAIELGTTVQLRRGGGFVSLRSDQAHGDAVVPIDVEDLQSVGSGWSRYVAGVVAELRPASGGEGTVTSNLPLGAGMSSSASLQVATALALGFEGAPHELAELCRRAEHRASGVPCGILDQMAIAVGTDGSLTRLDCDSLDVTPIRVPSEIVIIAVHSGQSRELAGSAYATRRIECDAAQERIGPLRDATIDDVEQLRDPILRRRARHVVTENQRVDAFIEALSQHHFDRAGALLNEGHASLRDDYQVSTSVLDDLVEMLRRLPHVYGARLTGGGFGGAAIAVCGPAVEIPSHLRSWRLAPVTGTRCSSVEAD